MPSSSPSPTPDSSAFVADYVIGGAESNIRSVPAVREHFRTRGDECLAIVEVFQSVQGEGSFAGQLTTFVRLQFCSLRCEFCDTDFNIGELKSFAEVAAMISEPWPRRRPPIGTVLTFTGGEPLLHGQQLVKFIDYLRDDLHWTFTACLETSGSVPLPHGWSKDDKIILSPKVPIPSLKIIRFDEIKLVYTGQSMEAIDGWLIFAQTGHAPMYLQPTHSKSGPPTNLEDVLEVLRLRPQIRLSVQTHKLLGLQ